MLGCHAGSHGWIVQLTLTVVRRVFPVSREGNYITVHKVQAGMDLEYLRSLAASKIKVNSGV